MFSRSPHLNTIFTENDIAHVNALLFLNIIIYVNVVTGTNFTQFQSGIRNNSNNININMTIL